MDEENQENNQEEEIKVSDYVKKFKASEQIMRDEFLPKYTLAKSRLRSETSMKHKGTKKLTHEEVNLVHSIGVNFVNSVYFKSPYCNLTARREEARDKVEDTEVAVNDWLKDKKVKKVVKRTIWDAYLGGVGAVYTDYEYDDVEDKNDPVMIPQVTGYDEMGQPIEEPVQDVDEEGKPLFNRIELKNDITIQRIRPDLLRFPEGFDFDNPLDSPWVGFDCIHPIDYVKKNESWDADVREQIEGERYDKLSNLRDGKASKAHEGTEKYAKISYVFIKPDYPKLQPFKLMIFCDSYTEKPLALMDFKKGHTGYPIKFITFNPLDDDCSYPNGDPWNFESQLNAVDEWWKKMVNHTRRSNPKIVYDMGSVTEQEAKKLKSNNDNELVGLRNKQQRALRDLVQDLNAPTMGQDHHILWETAKELISEISPRAAISRGGDDGKAETATEAKIMQAGEMIDTDARIDDVRDFIVDIVRDVAGIYETSLVGTISLEKEGFDEEGNELKYFEDKGSDAFTSDIEIDVDVESMQAQNKDVLRRHLIQSLELFTKLQPFLGAVGKTIDPEFWIEKLMDTMYIRNIEKGFVDLQPMMPQAPVGPEGVPQGAELPEVPSGDMPADAVEAGAGQRI